MLRILLLSTVLSLGVAGCQQTPLQRVETARTTYVTFLHEVNILHRAGKITVEDKKRLAPTTQAIADTLNIAEATAGGGSELAVDSYLALFNALLDKALEDAGFDPTTLKRTR